MCAESDGTVGRGTQRDPGLRRERVGLRSLRRVAVRSEIVRRERSRQLVRAETLEVASGREMPRPPVAARQRVVGDLPDQGLDERVLAPLGRARIRLQREQLAPDEGPQAWLEAG